MAYTGDSARERASRGHAKRPEGANSQSTPVFKNGSGTVQSRSDVGFETLYAGYRFDGTSPQMYYVRNRFLLPMIGTWNRRDPLGYVDGMANYTYVVSNPIASADPLGLYKIDCN